MNENLNVVRYSDGELCWTSAGDNGPGRSLADPAVREELRAALATRRGRLVFAAPGEQVRLLSLAVSADEKKHLAKALPFLVEEAVAEDIEAVHVAHVLRGPTLATVMLCSHSRMQRWQSDLADLPRIESWTPEPLLLPWRSGEWCLVFDGDRVILRTGEGEGSAVEITLLPAYLASLLADSGAPEVLVIYGHNRSAELAALPEVLADRAQWRSGGFAAALWLHDSAAALPSLLQGGYAPRLPLQRWARQWRWPAAAVAAALVLQLAATWADYLSLREENRALRSAIEERYREINPRGALVDAETQLRRQLDALSGSAQGAGFTRMLETVGGVIAKQPGTGVASINYNQRGGDMRLAITASDYAAVERIREALDAAGIEAVLENSATAGDGVRARLRVGGAS
ncbi:MAG: type II secretion system protein GspL [Chromatocurvus sp.]